MTPAEFLSAVWPAAGPYVLATPFMSPTMTRPSFRHRTFDTIAQVVAYTDTARSQLNLFFGVHGLKQHRVWNPLKLDPKTNELGAYEVRTQSNSRATKSFYFDIDVGSGAHKYATQAEALQGLKAFCDTTGLPRPMMVTSGTGLHVYWTLTEEITSDDWRGPAIKLKLLARHLGLRADPARTSDSASVLRVPGTFNHKDAATPRPVILLTTCAPMALADFVAVLDTAMIRADLKAPAMSKFAPVDALGFENNTKEIFSGPPVTLKSLVTVCAQVRRVVLARGNVSEPEWYHTLNLVRFTEGGDQWVHKMSEGHPGYSFADTEAKVAQLVAKDIKPTTCFKLAEVCGDDACVACPFASKAGVTSPIGAAYYRDPAPPPVVQFIAPQITTTIAVPDPPAPYTRTKDGKIAFHSKNKEGEEIDTIICDYDLFPLQRVIEVEQADGTEARKQRGERQVWRAMLPRSGAQDFTLDAAALYDRRMFTSAIANQGIYPTSGNLPYLQEYMVAYIAELQRLSDAEQQHNHLGWTQELDKFILPDHTLHMDGTVTGTVLSRGARTASSSIRKHGVREAQIAAMGFYNHPAYLAHQFLILSALAAPIFYATTHHGAIVNATGETGASKSTAIYTAASIWGQPELYTINGTSSGATNRGRDERLTTYANLPVCVDEITKMEPKDVHNMAMGVTQPGHRIRLKQNGDEQPTSTNYRATIMITTANTSLHAVLSTDNASGTAGSMRVVEVLCNKALVHEKWQADNHMVEIKNNYGHIGPEFMAFVMTHRAAVEGRVRKVMKEIDADASIDSGERFWSAVIAAALVAGEIGKSLRLMPYDVSAIRAWAIERLLPTMRGIVATEYATPLTTLTDYLESINSNMVVISEPSQFGQVHMVKEPRGALMAHYDRSEKVMYVLKKPFRDYCARSGANAIRILEELHTPKVTKDGRSVRLVASKHIRKILGAETLHAKGQSWCFAINMDHPYMLGRAMAVVGGAADAARTPPRGELRAVGDD